MPAVLDKLRIRCHYWDDQFRQCRLENARYSASTRPRRRDRYATIRLAALKSPRCSPTSC